MLPNPTGVFHRIVSFFGLLVMLALTYAPAAQDIFFNVLDASFASSMGGRVVGIST